LAGRKVNANAPAGSTLFGQQNQPQNSGLFGSALSKPATGGLFSNSIQLIKYKHRLYEMFLQLNNLLVPQRPPETLHCLEHNRQLLVDCLEEQSQHCLALQQHNRVAYLVSNHRLQLHLAVAADYLAPINQQHRFLLLFKCKYLLQF
jgi:hypothetical protein